MKGKFSALAEPIRRQPQQQRRQIGAQHLRFGELRARLEILLGVEPQAQARTQPAAAPLALVGARPRHRLDRQTLQPAARAVAADARQSRIDDRAHRRAP